MDMMPFTNWGKLISSKFWKIGYIYFLETKKLNNSEKSLERHFLIFKTVIVWYNTMRNIWSKKVRI